MYYRKTKIAPTPPRTSGFVSATYGPMNIGSVSMTMMTVSHQGSLIRVVEVIVPPINVSVL